MKKAASILLFILLMLLLLFKLWKVPTAKKERESTEVPSKESAEKENVRNFWVNYRQATNNRIAREWGMAAAEYEKALTLDSEHEDALYYLGNMYLELGEFGKAEKTWLRLENLNSKSPRVHFQLGSLYLNYPDSRFFNIEKAKIFFQKALAMNKEETGALLYLGQIELLKGKLEKAQTYFAAVTGSNFKSVPAHFLNGYIAWKRGDSKEALTSFDKAIQYSRPTKPKMGVLGEGDAKFGKSFGRPKKKSLFNPYLRDLAGVNEKNTRQEMEARYRHVDKFLKKIKFQKPQ